MGCSSVGVLWIKADRGSGCGRLSCSGCLVFNQWIITENLGKFVDEVVGWLGDFYPLLALGTGMRGCGVVLIIFQLQAL